MIIRLLLACAALFMLAPSAAAQEKTLFCPALREEATYGKTLDSYKYMIEGTDGWIFRTEPDFRQHFELNAGTIRHMLQLQEALQKRGVTLVIVFTPTRGMIAHDHIKPADAAAFGFTNPDAAWKEYESSIAAMQKAGVHIVGISRQNEGKDFFYKQDHHWNSGGAKIAADSTAAYIKQLPVYAGLEKAAFATEVKGDAPYKGSWARVFRQVCKSDLPAIKVPHLQTSRREQAVTANDLFGDAALPQIALLGTSNSTAEEPSFANFEGFLKEDLSADILNFSVPGAGIETSFFEWLASDHIKSGRARLAIWEIPGHYELAKEARLFRQLTPLIAGDCGGAAIRSVSGASFKGSMAGLFSGLAPARLSGDGYYLHINFAEPLKQNFVVRSVYAKGEDRTWISRRERAKASNEYSLQFKNWKKGALQSVTLEAPVAMDGVPVNAKICKLP